MSIKPKFYPVYKAVFFSVTYLKQDVLLLKVGSENFTYVEEKISQTCPKFLFLLHRLRVLLELIRNKPTHLPLA